MSARHMKSTLRWGTDAEQVALARCALSSTIDLDPCSEAFFNETVQATHYYSLTERGEDGLMLPWRVTDAYPSTLLINPAGGQVREFWRKLVAEYAAGNVMRAVWIGFSIEQLCVLADEPVHPLDYATVFLRDRIPFAEPPDLAEARRIRCEAAGRPFNQKSAPSHSNYVTLLGVDPRTVQDVYGAHGRIVFGTCA